MARHGIRVRLDVDCADTAFDTQALSARLRVLGESAMELEATPDAPAVAAASWFPRTHAWGMRRQPAELATALAERAGVAAAAGADGLGHLIAGAALQDPAQFTAGLDPPGAARRTPGPQTGRVRLLVDAEYPAGCGSAEGLAARLRAQLTAGWQHASGHRGAPHSGAGWVATYGREQERLSLDAAAAAVRPEVLAALGDAAALGALWARYGLQEPDEAIAVLCGKLEESALPVDAMAAAVVLECAEGSPW